MSSRAIRRAAERKAAKLARKAHLEIVNHNDNALPVAEAAATQPDAAVAVSTIATAFDFTDEEDDALALTSNLTEEKSFAASASDADASADSAVDPPSEHPPAKPPISAARLEANRSNSLLSTGPRTQAGKAKSSLNAIKTGLTSRVVVLPNEDATEYQKHLERRFSKYAPATDDEHMLVQNIVDNEWRLARIAPLETSVYALGDREFANEFPDEPNPATRAALIKGKTFMHYRRDLSNLALQERRLRNHLETDIAKLETLQKSRKDRRRQQIAYCQKLRDREGAAFQPSDCGFDFSNDELSTFIQQTSTQFRLMETRPDFDLFLAARRQAQKEAQAA